MMTKLLALVCFFIPHPINKWVRILFGQQIGRKSKIHIFSLVLTNELKLGERTTISPLSLLKANRIILGNDVQISSLTIINSALVEKADFIVGDFSRIFPLCWLEPGEGITIGQHVGIGGHTLIFTHGSWSNYLMGGPVEFGPVVIEDNVWLPWRIFVMPNVTIGRNSIIGANSTVTKNVPPHSLAAGSPAKILKDNMNVGLDAAEFEKRCEFIIKEYDEFSKRASKTSIFNRSNITILDTNHSWGNGKKVVINLEQSTYQTTDNDAASFILFLRRFGIRLRPCL